MPECVASSSACCASCDEPKSGDEDNNMETGCGSLDANVCSIILGTEATESHPPRIVRSTKDEETYPTVRQCRFGTN